MKQKKTLDKSGQPCHNVAMPARQAQSQKKKKPTSARVTNRTCLGGPARKSCAPHFKRPGFDLVIRYGNHYLRVTGTIQPAEKPSWGPNGGDPGCPACVEDLEAYMIRGYREHNLGELPGKLRDELEELVFEQLA